MNQQYYKKTAVILCLILLLSISSADADLNTNDHYILPPDPEQNRNTYLAEMKRLQNQPGPVPKLNSASFCACMVMLFDSDIYDPVADTWKTQSFLDKTIRDFGPLDVLIPWHGYPRLGIDDRDQFDIWHDLPGGIEGLRDFVTICRDNKIRVLFPYQPWDTGTRRPAASDFDLLADLVRQTAADGVFLDTLSAGSPELRQKLNQIRPDLEVMTEGTPAIEQLPFISGTWGQWLSVSDRPGILKLKWLQPDFPQYLIRRWDRNRAEEIQTAFFNAAGILVWENIFGVHNPWNPHDKKNWKKANLILHHFSDIFQKGQWEPFLPVSEPNFYANCWSDKNQSLYIYMNTGRKPVLLRNQSHTEYEFFNLWSGKRIEPQIEKETAIDQIGCILSIRKSAVTPALISFLEQIVMINSQNDKTDTAVVIPAFQPEAAGPTSPASKNQPPPGMVYIPAAQFTMQIRHQRRESGCYLDTPDPNPQNFGHGLEFNAVYPQIIHQDIEHKIPVKVAAFFIDRSEVTNKQYQEFLDASGYKPKHPTNFLKHWPDGKMPPELADHPVVYVDIDDARAYAKWAGKRLPTEPQWQLAAQGTDGRKWPWGPDFDPAKCNSEGKGTMPADSLPEGKSPCGCYHMTGNVWEWTEPTCSDGHTRFAIIRGGSYYKAQGSLWYTDGGPQPANHHAKFILTSPALDRCATVGFRCIKDIE